MFSECFISSSVIDSELEDKLDRLLKKCKCSKVSVVTVEGDEPDTEQTNTFQLLDDDVVVFVACDGTVVEFSSGGASYSVYTALLTQSGTNAPVANVLENTIGNIVWTRDGVGSYFGTLTNAFTANKTLILPPNRITVDGSGNLTTTLTYAVDSVSQVSIGAARAGIGAEDGIFTTPIPVEIRVYS